MNPTTAVDASASLQVRNLGGIDETEVTLSPGVNVLEGRNATNRTSLLRSLMAALGSDAAALKRDADQGRVELAVDGETYTRTFTRENGSVETDGDPYLEDATVADLFAFLLEDNDARQAVAQQGNLRDVIMRPVDTAEIEREIRDAEREKSRIDEKLADLRDREDRLPELEAERDSLEREIAETRAELEDVTDELSALDADVSESRAQRDEFEETLAELNDARAELESVRDRLDSQTDQRDALKAEREELKGEREDLPTSVREITDLGQRIGELRERKRTLDSLLDRLQNVIQFNRDVLEDADGELREALVADADHVTDELVAGNQRFVCWTCGSDVERSDVEATIDNLRDLREERMEERRTVTDELEELQAEKRKMEQHQQRREQIDHQLDQIDDKLDRTESVIDDLREERSELVGRVERLESELESLNREEDRVLELNKRANELELELEDLESDLEDVESRIESIEADVAERDELESQREDVSERLTALRTRIESIEADAVEAFNDHMETVLGVLEYENIDRIWLERRSNTERGRRQTEQSVFDLHVVRVTDEGTAFEDTVDHLSESEREVTGLVFALAGYLVHEVYEEVPFMVLDSLEAVDSERIAALVEYFSEFAPYLVVALLREDARALPEDHTRIRNI